MGTFECTYVKGSKLITQDELTEKQKTQCGIRYASSCKCEQIATKCTFGPDHGGEFIVDQVVPDGTANGCDRDFCVCTSHDNYHETVAERLANAVDTTVKPGTEVEEEGTDEQGEPEE